MGGPIVSAVVSAVVPALIDAIKLASIALLTMMLLMGTLVWGMMKIISLFGFSLSNRVSASKVTDAEYLEFSKPSGFQKDDWWENGETSLGRNFKF